MNLLKYLSFCKKEIKCLMEVGGGRFSNVSIFSGSTSIPSNN